MYDTGFVWYVIGVGFRSLIVFRSFLTVSIGESLLVFSLMNSPGILRVVPYSSSAGDVLRSALYAFRKLRSINGSLSVHSFAPVASIADLTVRCHRSIMPFDCGWYGVVRM